MSQASVLMDGASPWLHGRSDLRARESATLRRFHAGGPTSVALQLTIRATGNLGRRH